MAWFGKGGKSGGLVLRLPRFGNNDTTEHVDITCNYSGEVQIEKKVSQFFLPSVQLPESYYDENRRFTLCDTVVIYCPKAQCAHAT